jgi:pseudaminic acid biosynthesis-associated methylase
MNEQQIFWAEEYATEYIEKNRTFDQILGEQAWNEMLKKTDGLKSILECGCNIGRNLNFLNSTHSKVAKSIIEISPLAYKFVSENFKLKEAFNSSIIDANFPEKFDLVFTMGVLIHIHPDDLLKNMQKMYDFSDRYILMGEYFSRTPVMLEYQGAKDRLFKCDFGKLFQENFPVQLVDYGFLWGHIFDLAGFDDITWWLFKK